MQESAQLVIFDCDGVLVDSEGLCNEIEAEYFERFGVTLQPAQLGEAYKGKSVAQVHEHLQTIAEKPLPPEFMYEWAMAIANGFVRSLRAVDGIAATLDCLQQTGVKYCVASQSPPSRIRLSLHITGLEKYFAPEATFSATMVQHPKPAPDLFLLAAQHMGAEPGNCVVIEDSPSGVLAAKAAGMTVYGYAGASTNEEAEKLQAAGARVFTDMSTLPALLR